MSMALLLSGSVALIAVCRIVTFSLVLTKTGSQTPHLQSQRTARVGLNLRNLRRIAILKRFSYTQNEYIYIRIYKLIPQVLLT